MAGRATLLELVPLLDRLHDALDLEHLVLQPHLYVDERVGERVRQVVEVGLETGVVLVLEQQLFVG